MDPTAKCDHVLYFSLTIYISALIGPLRAGAPQGRSHAVVSVPFCSPNPPVFKWELHIHAKPTQSTELTVLSPCMSQHVEGSVPQSTADRGQIHASYQPGVSVVGHLFIFCDVALVGAKVQTQGQLRHLVPYPKPSLRNARQSDSQPRGHGEG